MSYQAPETIKGICPTLIQGSLKDYLSSINQNQNLSKFINSIKESSEETTEIDYIMLAYDAIGKELSSNLVQEG